MGVAAIALSLLAALLAVVGPTLGTASPAAAQAQTTFEVIFTLGTVVDIDTDKNKEHDFAGTTITVRFTPLTTSPPGCSTGNAATMTFTIGTNGSLTAPTTNLINTPTGETNQCAYLVTFPITPALGIRLNTSPFPTETVRSGSSDIRFNYRIEEADKFRPNIEIKVPQYDKDDDPGTNFFALEHIFVGVRPEPDTDRGCSGISDRFRVQNESHVVSAAGPAGVLVLTVNDDSDTQCEYRVTFSENVNVVPTVMDPIETLSDGTTPAWELHLQSGHSTDFNHTNSIGTNSLQATYHGITRFEPTANITVPTRTGTGTDSAFADTTFDVSYMRQPSSHQDCSAATAVTVTYTVDANGDVATNDPLPVLVDRPLGETTRCIYNVTTPQQKTQAPNSELAWTLTPDAAGHTTQVSGVATEVTAGYDVGEITFVPQVAIAVPSYDRDTAPGTNWFEGKAITVEFDRATGPNNCTPDGTTFTYTVQPNGSATASPEPRLVDYPAGQTTRCTYTATYPPNEDGGTDLDLVTTGSSAPDTSTDATDRQTGAAYDAQTSFNPQLDISVIYIDDTANPGSNVLADETITASYAPVDDPPQNAACSGFGAAPDPTETYTVGSGGSVMAGGMVDGPGTAVDLVDRPRGETTRCRYRVDLTDSIGTGANEADLVVGDGQPIAATETVIAEYSDNFIPEVVLDLPDYDRDGAPGTDFFDGAVFGIMFDRADAARTNCSAGGTHNYVVQTDGSLLPENSAFSLVSRPQGEADCEYTVVLPADVSTADGVSPGWTLTRQATPPPTAMVSPAAPTITGTYHAETKFAADITIGVPHRNNVRGDQITVTFARVAGGASCTFPASKTYTVGDTFTVTPNDGAPVFIDRPAGTTDRCMYRATFPESVASFTTNSKAPGFSRQRTFTSGQSLTFNYGIGRINISFFISVPTYERDNEPGVSFYDGLEISASVAPTSDSSPWCTTATNTFRWETSTFGYFWAWPTQTRVFPFIYGAGSADECEYDVTFPTPISTAEGVSPGYTLTLQPGSTTTINQRNRDLNPRYSFVSHFIPDIDFTVPYIARGASNALEGQTITVEYTPATTVPPQHAGCLAASETYTIAAGRSATDTAVLEFVSPNTAATLIDRPAGQTNRCRYIVNYTDNITSGATSLDLTTPDNTEIGATSMTQEATYAGTISFEPNITISVPQYDRDGEVGTNFFAGAEFVVEFDRAPGAAGGCSPDDTEITYVVSTGGIVEISGTSSANTLVGIPAGAAEGVSCSYVAMFPDSEQSGMGVTPAWVLNRDGGASTATADIGLDTPEVVRRYIAPASSFMPTVAITVSPHNPTSSRNLFTGTTFDVEFDRALNSHTNCSAATTISVTYTVQTSGDVTTSDTLPTLTDRPQGQDDRCVYDVTTPMSRSQSGGSQLMWTLERQTGHTESINGRVFAVEVDYEVGNVTFEPEIDVTVPPYLRDLPADAAPSTTAPNWFEGEILNVRFTRSGGPALGCSGGAGGVEVEYTVQADGSVSGTAGLVDYPAGQTVARCIYAVTWPPGENDREGDGVVLQLVTTGADAPDTFTEAPDPPTSATYRAQTSFSPSLEFSVPFVDSAAPSGENDLSGQTIMVSYAPVVSDPVQHSACVAATEIWTIGTGGTLADGGQASIVSPNTAATLVDRPLGETDRCRYAATFPASVGTAATGTFDRSTPETVEFDASEELSPRYSGDIFFDVAINITVPQVNGSEDDETTPEDESMQSRYTGSSFAVSFADGTGPATGCSTNIDDVTVVVQPTGQVTGTVSLVDRPDGQTMQCSYDVTFPVWVAAPFDFERLRVQSGFSTEVSASSDTAMASYVHGASILPSPADIVVPSGGNHVVGPNSIYEDYEFMVTYRRSAGGAGANEHCGTADGMESGTSTFSVTSSGTVVAKADAPFVYLVSVVFGTDANGDLLLLEGGGRDTSQDVSCSYELTWPSMSGSVLRLSNSPGPDTMSTPATDENPPAAHYDSLISWFSPVVGITVPPINTAGTTTNMFSGTDFAVTFTRTAEPEAGMPENDINTWCTATATETHRVRDNGDVTREGSAANLVGSIEGLGSCSYNVAFPPTADAGNLTLATTPPPTATVSDTSTTATAAYGPTAAISFTAMVDITFPNVNGDFDIEGTTVDETTQSAFTGTEFVVSFADGTGPATGCSSNIDDVTYTVQTNGSVSGSDPTLVDYPAGATVPCSYGVTFPEWVSALFTVAAPRDSYGRWLRQAGYSTSVSAASATASVTYASGADLDQAGFVNVVVPSTSNSPSEYSGIQFRIVFTQVDGADPRCVAGDGSTTGIIQFRVSDFNTVVVNEAVNTAASFLVTTIYGFDGDGNRDMSQDVTCNYDIEFPTTARELNLDMDNPPATVSTPANRDISADPPEATYELDIRSFEPEVSITVPQINRDGAGATTNMFSGSQFTVNYARSAVPSSGNPRGELATWCTASASETYQVRDDGTVTLEGSAASLVDTLTALSGRCSYDVSFPGNNSDNTLARAADPVPMTTADHDTEATVSYATAAAETIDVTTSITVPPFDDDTTPGNDFAGAVITIAIAPAASVPAELRPDCTTVSHTTTIQSSGALDPLSWSPSLVDRPAGAQSAPGAAAQLPRCSYAVTHTIDNTALAAGNALAAQPGATVALDHANTAISVIYGLAQADTFNAAVTITVPDLDVDNGGAGDGVNDFTGASFDVSYAPAANAAQCATLTGANAYRETYQVGTTRTAERLSTTPAVDLTFRWAGAYQAGDECSWNLTFPPLVASLSGGSVALDTATVDTTATNADPAASADYDNSGDSLAVDVSIVVPQFNDDGDSANDFSGTTIRVSFTSSQMGCLDGAANYVVDDDGNVMLDGLPPALVDRPVGVTLDDDRCTYAVAFPPTVASSLAGVDLLLRMGATTTVRFDSTSASAGYDSDTISFTPALGLTVPQYLADDSANNAFAGVEFTVTYSTDTADCVATTTESYVVSNEGTVALAQPAPPMQPVRASLVDRPARTDNVRCSFDVAFASDAVDGPAPTLLLAQGAVTTVSRSAAALTVAFDNTRTDFTPVVAPAPAGITVPQLDHMTDQNVFAGAEFTVTFAAGTGPAAGCSPVSPATAIDPVTYTVQGSGAVSLTSGTLPTLVDRPERQTTRCSYDVGITAEVSSSDLTPAPTEDDPTWTLTPAAGRTMSVGGGAAAIDVGYEVKSGTNITFVPEVSIVVPPFNLDDDATRNWFVDEEFTVSFARSAGPATGCSATSFTYVVQANRTVTARPSPAPQPELVDYPNGATTRCTYAVTFPPNETDRESDGNFVLELKTASPAPDLETSALARDAGATYAHRQISFNPQVSLSVPFIDNVDPSGQNDLAGVEIQVSYAPVAAPSQNAACSGFGAAPDPTETYTIGTGGTLLGGGMVAALASGDRAVLVDRPADVNDRCRYLATFASSIATAAGETFQPAASEVEFEATDTLEPRYEGDTYFTVALSIGVPQYNGDDDPATDPLDESTQNWYVGVQFEVEFDRTGGPTSNCSPDGTTFTYEVQPGGAVTPLTTPVLVNVPDTETENCVYTAEFPESISSDVGDVPAWTLRLQGTPGSVTAQVSEDAAAHTRSYLADAISFMPTVEINVPQVDHRVDENVFAGAEFTVSFAAGTGPASGCDSTIAPVTYAVQANGDVDVSSGALPMLVDRPAEQNVGCEYVVTVEPATRTSAEVSASGVQDDGAAELSWSLTRGAGVTDSVYGGALAIEADYAVTAGTDITFEADVGIAVPQFNIDDDPATMDVDESTLMRNWFSGETFMVGFSQVSGGPAAGCSPDRTLTFTIQNDGSVTTTGDLTFVDYPNAETVSGGGTGPGGVAARCSYTASYPSNETDRESDGNFVLDLVTASPDAPDTETAALDSGTGATYHAQTNFSPAINIAVPFIDIDDPVDSNDLAGVEIEVSYAPIANPAQNEACSGFGAAPDPTETYIVDTSGSFADGGSASLDGMAVSLVDRPRGTDARCRYAANFPDQISTAAAGNFDVSSGDMGEIRATGELTAIYSGDTIFEPAITIGVPQYNGDDDPATDPLDESTQNWYVGTEFRVEFDPAATADDACTDENTFITYVVLENGDVEASGSSTLIDVPEGQTVGCAYVARFPMSVSSDVVDVPAWTLNRDGGAGTATASVTRGGTAVERGYLADVISFVPTVDIDVPQVDHRADENVFVGAEFMVSFAAGTGPASGCSPVSPATAIAPVTYAVQANGDVDVSSGALPTLVDRPAEQDTRCEYVVTVEPATRTSAEVSASGVPDDGAGELVWSLTRGAGVTASVNGGALAVEADYAVTAGTDITFDAEVNIAVPPFNLDDDATRNWFSGEMFMVSFSQVSGSDPASGCSPDRTLTFTIQNDSSVTTTGELTFVDYPNGETARCSYDVTYPDFEVGGTMSSSLLKLVTTGAEAPDLTVSALAHAPDATYDHTRIDFSPSVELSVPFVDNVAPSGQNDLAGQRITINYAPITDPTQDSGCTTSAEETYLVDTSGSFSGGGNAPLDSAAAGLVDRPEGVDARCRYMATFSSSIATAAAETFRVRAAAAEFEATDTLEPTYAGDTYFTVALSIGVPQYNGDDDPATDPLDESTQNWYVGERFTVEFDQAPGAHANCSPDGTTFTYEVQPGGTATSSAATVLVDVPHEQTSGCAYVAEFPESVSSDVGDVPAWTLRLQGTPGSVTAQVSESAAAHTRSYLADVISFVPTVDIDVPQVDHRADENVFVGAEFTVSFAAGTGPASGCDSTIAPVTYAVQANGDVDVSSGALPTLVDRPARQDTRCEYVVTVEPATRTSAEVSASAPQDDGAGELVWSLTRGAGVTASVNGGALAIEADYAVTASTDITFEAEVNIGVPPFTLDDDATRNWFSGETFMVSFAEAAGGPASGCSPDRTLTFTIQNDSSVTTTGELTFVDYPNGAAARCSYTVTYPDFEVGGTMSSSLLKLVTTGAEAPDLTVSALAHAPDATYDHTRIDFSPSVTVSVPFVDLADPRGQNDLAGQRITINYAPITDPTQDPGCTTSAEETYLIDTSGTLGGGGNAPIDGSAATLTDRPEGVDARCQYSANFSDEVGTQTTGVFELATADMLRFDGDDPLRPVYSGDRFFAVDLTIGVPQYNGDDDPATDPLDESTQNWYVGEEFRVDFVPVANSAEGCSQAGFETYEVNAAGLVVPSDGEFALVDIPERLTTHCAYTLSFPVSVSSAAGDAPAWTLRRQGGAAAASADVSVTGAAVSVSYLADTIYFVPAIAATVPDVDGVTAGVSVFGGLRFMVSLLRRTGAGLADTGCSATSEMLLAFVVAPNGGVSGAVPTQLVDRPQRSDDRCDYAVGFPASLSSLSGAALTWELSRSPDAGTSVSGGDASATSTYTVGAVSFVPDVAISVPPYNRDDDPATDSDESRSNAFAGLSFMVQFDKTGGVGPASDCSGADSVTYEVQPSGTVSPTGAPLTLVDRPSATAARCVYTATFPASEDGGSVLERQTAATASVSGTSQAAQASYLTANDSLFAPAVSLTVDMLDGDRNSVHDLSGELIEVGFARVDGEPAQCTQSASEVYAIADDGTVSLAQPPAVEQAQSPASLVDRPAGRNARCQYDVSYPDSLDYPDTQNRALVLPRNVATRIDGGTRLVLAYAEPPAPSRSVEPVPLMSVNTGVRRLPVQVSLDVPPGVFRTADIFEVLVSVPGACGSDTFLFGGVPASAGVSYAAKATIRGEAVLLGEGTLFVNPRAAYSLPPYVDGPSGQESCAIRVTELASPMGCSLRQASGIDLLDRSYLQVTWAPGMASFDFTASYDCPSSVEQADRASLSLVQGWVTLSFNGDTGTTPEQLSQRLGYALSSVWVWDADAQDWLGWADQHGTLGLTRLTRGQTLFAYVPRSVEISYSPANLLNPPEPTGSLELEPGYNLRSYNGRTPTTVSSLVRQPSPIGVIFMWHAASQSWRYNLPGRQPLDNLSIEWFDTLNPGDSMFIYSASPEVASIPWA